MSGDEVQFIESGGRKKREKKLTKIVFGILRRRSVVLRSRSRDRIGGSIAFRSRV